MLHNLVLKATYLHYSMVMELIIELLVDRDQNFVYAPLLTVELEILVPFWAISNILAH
jgi:hypothetical protein